MSTSIKLLRDKNDMQYQKFLKILNACIEARINPPKEVDDYFGGEDDPEYPLEIQFDAREWSDEACNGLEIDIADLPDGVKTIRFYNCW